MVDRALPTTDGKPSANCLRDEPFSEDDCLFELLAFGQVRCNRGG